MMMIMILCIFTDHTPSGDYPSQQQAQQMIIPEVPLLMEHHHHHQQQQQYVMRSSPNSDIQGGKCIVMRRDDLYVYILQ